ncbi:MAG: lysophospholipid acyltransferase family protein [Proteobacteria bacterium]|nr:lysophospholipid acyltransferase family protein [Pseudomonadota bacterium]
MAERFLKLKRKIIKKLAPFFVSNLLKVLHKTIKWEIVGLDNLNNIKIPVIFAFFHGRMMMLGFFYKKIRKDRNIKMILSPHFDGEVGSLIAKRFGVDSIKGSSSKGSLKLLKEISKIKDSDIGITPDGPRGPFQKVKSGVTYISKVTGFPVVPVAYSVSRGKRLGSWDRFLVPYPFSRGVLVVGKPIYVPEDLDKEKIEEFSQHIEEEMIKVTNLADTISGFKI